MDDICQEILTMAKSVLGSELSAVSEELLLQMCESAHFEFFSRLREDVSVEEIHDQYVRAAGIMAVSFFLGLEPACLASYTAGNVTVRHKSEKEKQESIHSLRAQAEMLLLGYLKEREFCFRGVRA